MNKRDKIYVAGHRGLVGSAIFRALKNRGYTNVVTRTRKQLDLRNYVRVERFFKEQKPDYVFLAAARVGGIMANATYPAEFYYENITIATNVIDAAYHYGVKKLINLGSSCIYPKFAPQPLKEEYLLTGKLETTNEAYAVAKIGAIKMCKYYNEQYGTNFLSVMPTNLYGPNDTFDLETSHVLPALIRKIYETMGSGGTVTLWGDGSPRREFLYVDDLADALIYLMTSYDWRDIGEFINIGTGQDISIRELAVLIASVVGYDGAFKFDTTKPNGTPRKLMDVSKMTALGWVAKTSLREGIRKTYCWYRKYRQRELGIERVEI